MYRAEELAGADAGCQQGNGDEEHRIAAAIRHNAPIVLFIILCTMIIVY